MSGAHSSHFCVCLSRFDVVEELWRGLGENAEKLVAMLAGILQAANDEKQKEEALRMMQELSYEHEDFARVLVKPHNAKVSGKEIYLICAEKKVFCGRFW